MKENNYLQAVSLTKMWNTFSTESISDFIAEDIIYNPFGLNFSIQGKENYLSYIEQSIKTLKVTFEVLEFTFSCQLVQIDGFKDEYFILLKTSSKNSNVVVTDILDVDFLEKVLVKDGLINNIEFMSAFTDGIEKSMTICQM